MRKLVLDIQDISADGDFLAADPLAFGTWTRLAMFCATHMNGGVIQDCREWNDMRWLRACGVGLASLEACDKAKLSFWDGDDLHLYGYPQDQEKSYLAKSNGAQIARSKRLSKSLSDKGTSDIRNDIKSDINKDIKSDITSIQFPSSSSLLLTQPGPTAEEFAICEPYPPGDKRIYPKPQPAKVGLVEWLVHHPRCIVGKDRDLWQGLFDYAGHETMSDAYKKISGSDKIWFSTFNDFIHANYEESDA